MAASLLCLLMRLLMECHARRGYAARSRAALPAKDVARWVASDDLVEVQLVGVVLPAALVGVWVVLGRVYQGG